MIDRITQGRAHVRLIEGADVLLAGDLDEAERVLLAPNLERAKASGSQVADQIE